MTAPAASTDDGAGGSSPSGPPTYSLRNRLLKWVLVPLIGLSAVFAVETYFDSRRQANQAFDRMLAASALSIADRVGVGDDGGLAVDIPYVALEMLTSLAEERVFYQVRDRAGEAVTGYPGLPPPPEPPRIGGGPVFYDAVYRGVAIRGAAVAGAVSDAVRSIGYVVLVAETTRGREDLAQESLARVALRLAILVAVTSLMVWFGIRRGLAPLRRLEAAVARRSPEDLRPLRHETPAEAVRLVGAFNAFMGRLSETLGALRGYTGNVGHQLRTPLSVARTNLALAGAVEDAATADAHRRRADEAIGNAQRLVDQFLLLARVDESRLRHEGMQEVDLRALAEDAAMARVDAGLRAGLELALEAEPADGPCVVRGHPVLLRELILNLIDNAIRHAAPGTAIIRVRRDGPAVVLEVEDDGPGIDPARLDRALARFGQARDTSAEGLGLGLPICAEIVQAHGGRLDIAPAAPGQARPGLRITLRLPGRTDAGAAAAVAGAGGEEASRRGDVRAR